jgi:uncharacterized membrane protein YdcZ (DUF606 family)
MLEAMQPRTKGPRPFLFNWWVYGGALLGAVVVFYQAYVVR